jgi:sterol desaturase/sphingolipid hydroxylase (fatty acid hydroxylase superfamily)
MIRSVISGNTILQWWWVAMVAAGLVAGIASGFFKARKIQPRGFKWKIFRNEAFCAVITLTISGAFLGWVQNRLRAYGIITFRHEPAQWWVIALEYAAYFFGFDTWFYWLHRWMHKEPVYRWVHKLHHRSTSPNLLTTLSVHPLESLINGGWLVLFTSVFAVHDQAMLLMAPTAMIMGPYVHSGYEFLPRWWNRTWASKWFITATFHDQHHKYFTINYGGYTTIWDRLCGTMRPKYEAEFEKLTTRRRAAPLVPVEA